MSDHYQGNAVSFYGKNDGIHAEASSCRHPPRHRLRESSCWSTNRFLNTRCGFGYLRNCLAYATLQRAEHCSRYGLISSLLRRPALPAWMAQPQPRFVRLYRASPRPWIETALASCLLRSGLLNESIGLAGQPLYSINRRDLRGRMGLQVSVL
jgi:hypothetical protein